jgi:pectate lyase
VPATIVFRVGGIIKLVADLRSTRTAGTTLAGQTAPGGGITIRQHKVNLGGSTNLIVRNMRFRIGLLGDTAFAAGGSVGIENAGNFIFDHCEFGWSGEENMTMYDDNLATIQWSILHEGLYACGHSKGARSYASQWGGQQVTFHHNLLAHNNNRTPRFNGARSNDHNSMIDFVNNVNYNWGKENSCYGNDFDAGGQSDHCNMVNNYYKPGPARLGSSSSYFTQASFGSQNATQVPVFFMNGNYMEGSANTAKNTDNYLGLDASYYVAQGVAKTALIASTPFAVSAPVTTETAANAYQSVLAKAGVIPRDSTSRRIINEVRTGTASGKGTSVNYLNSDGTTYTTNPYYNVVKGIIDNPSVAFGPKIAYPDTVYTDAPADTDHDGMPDSWETAKGLNPNDANDRNTLSASGYTALEVYLTGVMGETIPFGTGLKKNSASPEIGFYPNPATDRINLVSPVAVRNYRISDLAGKCLQQGPGSTVIETANLPKGLFLLSLETETAGSVTLKFNK